MDKKNLFTYLLFLLLCLFYEILSLKFSIWTSKIWKILFYFFFISIFSLSIYSIIYIFTILNIKISFIIRHYKFYNYVCKIFSKSYIIIFIAFQFTRMIKSFNIDYKIYHKNCPFNLDSELLLYKDSVYENRICELYNIYNNSRYKYQYICSYNASDDFKNDKAKDGLDKIICIPKINNIENNDIINKFNKKYNNNKDANDSKLYYCSRIDKPEKNEYIKDEYEYCNMKNSFSDITSLLLILIDFLNLFTKDSFKYLDRDLSERINNFINQLRLYNYNEDDNDTEYDESNSNNVSFNEEEDSNIIVENNEIYDIDFNIKDYFNNEEKLKKD